jgi:hypothetical protein
MSVVMTISLTALAGIVATAAMCWVVVEILPKQDA